MSIAKSPHLAITRGEGVGCETIQIFVKSNRRWSAKPMAQEKIEKFIKTRKEHDINPIFSHNTYLVNLASPNEETLQKSMDCFLYEIKTSELLKLEYIVMHPGAHLDTGLEKGIKKIGENIRELILKTEGFKIKILIETMAGQGTNIGYKFEHIREIMDIIDIPERVGICFDTCHSYAAGYDFRSEKAYEKMMEEFDSILGLDNLYVLHLNDSVGALQSHLDRHEHIGKGEIGLEGFRNFILDGRFDKIPGVLETPKDKDMTMDKKNLEVLRSLKDE